MTSDDFTSMEETGAQETSLSQPAGDTYTGLTGMYEHWFLLPQQLLLQHLVYLLLQQ